MASKANLRVRLTGAVFILLHALHLAAHAKHREAIVVRGRALSDLSADLRGNLVDARSSHGDRKVYINEKYAADIEKAKLDFAAQIKALEAAALAALDINDINFAEAKQAYNEAIDKASTELTAIANALEGLDDYHSHKAASPV